MNYLRLAILTAIVSSTCASTLWGQNYKYEFEAREFDVASTARMPQEIELAPIGTLKRTEIEFAGHDSAYGENHWGEMELGRNKTNLNGPLVFYYEVHEIEAMKQRVAEADVVDEGATFPKRRSSVARGLCFGCRTVFARPPVAPKETAGLTVRTVGEPVGRSRYDGKPAVAIAKDKNGFIVVNYADSELLGLAP